MNEMLFYDLKQSSGLTHSLADSAYGPGALIEDETSLAEKYQVSRSVVRDAVKILVGKNLLEVRRGIGTRVRGRHSWGLIDDDVLAWHLSSPVRPEFLRQLMDMRVVLEPEAARWAALQGSEDSLAEIIRAQAAMEGVIFSALLQSFRLTNSDARGDASIAGRPVPSRTAA